MKKMYVLLVALLVMMLLSDELKSQTSELQWGKLNTGTDANILGIASIGTDIIIACGSGGTIIKSTDSGKTWQSKNSNVFENCNEIKFADANIGYILVNNRKLLKTVDGGETWTVISTLKDVSRKLFLIDADTLYAESRLNTRPNISKVIKSTDGGKNWEDIFTCPEPLYDEFYGVWLNQLFFIDNIGYVVVSETKEEQYLVYEYTVYKSTDYAKTWIPVTSFKNSWDPPLFLVSSYKERTSALFFTTTDSGVFYSEGKSFSTKDGFQTFEIHDSFIPRTYSSPNTWSGSEYVFVNFSDSGNHCAIYMYVTETGSTTPSRYNSTMAYSDDNGNTWSIGGQSGLPYGKTLYNTVCRVDNTFYIGCNSGGVILRSPAFPSTIDMNESLDAHIYPNPAVDRFVIYNSQFIIDDISIYDLTGRLCKTINVSSMESVVDIADFKSGIYIVKINTEQGSITKKITKQ